jgi:hypothetical protein
VNEVSVVPAVSVSDSYHPVSFPTLVNDNGS